MICYKTMEVTPPLLQRSSDATVMPPCQTADVLFLGAGGIDLSFLGPLIESPSTTFFREEEPILRAGECPED